MINTELKFQGKIHKVQKELRKMFKFQDQFDLEGQGQGHQFSNPSETFTCSINSLSWKVNFEIVQCLTVQIKNV